MTKFKINNFYKFKFSHSSDSFKCTSFTPKGKAILEREGGDEFVVYNSNSFEEVLPPKRKVTMWVNVYVGSGGTTLDKYRIEHIWPTKEEAINSDYNNKAIDTVPLTFEVDAY